MSSKSILTLALAGVLQIAAGAALAQEAQEPPIVQLEPVLALPLIQFDTHLAVPIMGLPSMAVASNDDLAAASGGQNAVVALTDQDLTAVNSGNRITADSVGSGAISISDSAFSGFAGIGNITMNTGHNNNLQSSLSVTIIVTD